MEIIFKGSVTGQVFPYSEPIWCGQNKELLNLLFEPNFTPDKINAKLPGLWRYKSALPFEKEESIVTLSEGNTPQILLDLPNGIKAWIKQDHLFPTGSYKDRGSSILLSKIASWGIKKVVQDSSGNAGASVAAYAARSGVSCDIYLPEDTSADKVVQIQSYGAKVIRVKGNRKKTSQEVLLAAENSFYASHSYHPLFFQGTKTFAYEICEQLNWKAPDTVVVPAGNGTLLLGCEIGFRELAQSGVIQKIPKLIAIQSEQCMPLKEAEKLSTFDLETYHFGATLAEGIAIPNPVRINQMLQAVKESGGEIICVTELEIYTTWHWMAKQGFYIEPTSAATLAGLIQYSQGLTRQETLVSLISGTGLKATEKISKMAKPFA